MTKTPWLISAVLAALPLPVSAGMAGPQACDERPVWESWLESQFSEYYAFTVTGPSQTQIEVWIDPDEGDWTMLGVAGNQLCEIMFGTNWPQRRR